MEVMTLAAEKGNSQHPKSVAIPKESAQKCVAQASCSVGPKPNQTTRMWLGCSEIDVS